MSRLSPTHASNFAGGCILATLCFATLAFGQGSVTPIYSFASFDYPGQNGTTVLLAVNNNAQVVGSFLSQAQFGSTAFLTDLKGTIGPSFQYENAALTQPTGINGIGAVIGTFSGSASGVFVRAPGGGMMALGLPDGVPEVSGAAISGNGSIVLSCFNNLYFKNPTSYTVVVVPEAGSSGNAANVSGVDDFGNVVGFYYPNGGPGQSFYRDRKGSFQLIDYPESVYTEVMGMNDLGTAVGFYWDGTHDHGFRWSRLTNQISTIDYPGAQSTFVSGINDFGALVGFYLDASGAKHGFTAIPKR